MCKPHFIFPLSILLTIAPCTGDAAAGTLKTHGIFSSNMVIQRDKPIRLWGWAEPGRKVYVQFGAAKAEATGGPLGGDFPRPAGQRHRPEADRYLGR